MVEDRIDKATKWATTHEACGGNVEPKEPSREDFKIVGGVLLGSYREVTCTGCGGLYRDFVPMEQALERVAFLEEICKKEGINLEPRIPPSNALLPLDSRF